MIRFESVSVTYPTGDGPALRDVDLTVEEGELCLVVGPTGAGKSTLLGAACARVPHFSGGLLEGRVTVAGRDTRTHLPRQLADVVGVVTQDPLTGFVTDTVEEELAFGLEQLGLPGPVMRKRVEETLDLLALAPLRDRALLELSGGEQQRVAIGAVMTAQPRVLVMDEPTSALDPTAAEDVLAAITRLVHDLGVTVLLAEHRLERVTQFADTVLLVRADGTAVHGAPGPVLAESAVAPPVVELGRLAGWDPLPLSVRDARRRATGLRDALGAGTPTTAHVPAPSRPGRPFASAGPAYRGDRGVNGATQAAGGQEDVGGRAIGGPSLLSARALRVTYGPVDAVRGLDLDVRAGEVVAVMGRNGSGKSSLLWALQGTGSRSAGTVRLPAAPDAPDPATLSPAAARRHVALVPQTPGHLLYAESVGAECAAADAGVAPGTTAALLEHLAPGTSPDTHPQELSEGGRLALALAVQLAADPPVLLLDEPTRGLDYAAKTRLAALLAARAAAGGAVVLTSHDVEFVAGCADRVVTLAQGEVVADGPARDILVASPTFAPQTAKILHPLGYLTVAEVRDALEGAR
ncbi:ABC transporter ATP-binding protein [Georgenia sp. H159]|uniref:ABC transporter ATP-binding protein n=1 Tax=Georgenia sp. H159 TaxID=3076115 RepID=UPI002D76AABB|nr:ATP-binding cassette domain-containing protein [Georgenia sp. H159]